MAKKYFGTDGVRGEVGQFPITPDFVLKLGYAAGQVLVQHDGGQKPTVLIGKDTRISGYMLEAALVAGFTAAGVNVIQTGPLPTPGVAYLTRALRLSGHRIRAGADAGLDGRGGPGPHLDERPGHLLVPQPSDLLDQGGDLRQPPARDLRSSGLRRRHRAAARRTDRGRLPHG